MEKEILQFTPPALVHLQHIIDESEVGEDACFRLTIKKSGCSGLRYEPEVVAEPQSGDLEVHTGASFKAYVDSECIGYLRGTVLDIQEQGVGQKQLIFRNPNSKDACGCGESFSVDDDE